MDCIWVAPSHRNDINFSACQISRFDLIFFLGKNQKWFLSAQPIEQKYNNKFSAQYKTIELKQIKNKINSYNKNKSIYLIGQVRCLSSLPIKIALLFNL